MAKQKQKDNAQLSTAEQVVLIASWIVMVPSAFFLQFLFVVPFVYFVVIISGLALLGGAVKADTAKRPTLFFSVVGALSALWLLWAYRDIFQY